MAEFKYHTRCDKCGSKDNLAVYSDGSYFCFSYCGNKSASQEYIASLEDNNKSKSKRNNFKSTKEKEEVVLVEKSSKPIITEDQKQEIRSCTSFDDTNYRHITQDTYKFFGVRTGFDTDDNPIVHYYPCTQNSELVGYKVRELPKQFGGNLGRTGKECELFGQFRFKNPDSKYCLIVGGEIDVLSAYQMLMDYNKRKGNDYDVVVVSPTIGETGCEKQLAAQYEWFAQFEKIIVGFDNDKAGKEATEKAVSALPKGKVFIAHWSHKDPNEYLKNDDERLFISDYYNAEKYVPAGVVSSNQISPEMRAEINVPKVPLPKFMWKLQDMMAGGIPLGRIVNLGAASGVGKSSVVDEIIYYMLFNSPHLVGVVTLESTCGQYGVKLLSRHISRKLELLDNTTALMVMNSPEVLEKEKELFSLPNGDPRFYLVDDRDGDVTDIQGAIENLIIGCGVKVIVLDPVSDVIASLPLDAQENFMSWQKGMVKSHQVTFINVCHTRKTSSGQKAGSVGGDLHEEDIIGSSSLYKSAACNLMFTRNKESEDEIERNTTIMKATKIRWTGKTGIAGMYYYDNETHTLYDLDDWMNNNR
jgi:archaellum biogenesis ATPase FlaH